MANKIIRCTSQKVFEQITKEYISTGYEYKLTGGNKTVFIKRKKKDHMKIFLLTVWFTLGIGSIIYAIMPAKIEDIVVVVFEK